MLQRCLMSGKEFKEHPWPKASISAGQTLHRWLLQTAQPFRAQQEDAQLLTMQVTAFCDHL